MPRRLSAALKARNSAAKRVAKDHGVPLQAALFAKRGSKMHAAVNKAWKGSAKKKSAHRRR